MTSGVYIITNRIDMKQYIGSAFNVQTRFAEHKRGCKSNLHLKNAIMKYGIENFEFDILEECNPENCIGIENYYLELFKPEYNIASDAKSSAGYKHTAEARAKISAAHTGKKLSEEHKAKIGAAGKGHRHSDEIKARMSAAQMGNKKTLGKHWKRSPESCARMAALFKGRPGPKHSEEINAKISATLMGHKHSEETLAKLRGRKRSEEAKALMSASAKAAWARRKEEENNA